MGTLGPGSNGSPAEWRATGVDCAVRSSSPVCGKDNGAPVRLKRLFGRPFGRTVLLVFIVFLTGIAGGVVDGSSADREYALKAAFLFHFTQFVEWPEEARPAADEPLRIGVLNPNPFGTILDEIVAGETVGGRPVEVRYFDRPDPAEPPHILFIPAAARERRREALDELKNRPVLLVGEDRDFLRDGGLVSLIREENRVAITLSRRALDRSGLTVSSRLLRLARFEEGP